jgi:hypothetical protein
MIQFQLRSNDTDCLYASNSNAIVMRTMSPSRSVDHEAQLIYRRIRHCHIRHEINTTETIAVTLQIQQIDHWSVEEREKVNLIMTINHQMARNTISRTGNRDGATALP